MAAASRPVGAVFAFMLAVAACGDAGSDVSASTTVPASATEVTASTASSGGPGSSSTTTVAGTTTTGAPATTTTTTAATTTTRAGEPVTAGPNIPVAVSAAEAPWDEVAAGWHLVLYESTQFGDGPVLLYLADPVGTLYELASYPGLEQSDEPGPVGISDWRPDGRAALLQFWMPGTGRSEYRLVDLVTGEHRTVLEPSGERFDPGDLVRFTRPTGMNLVVHVDDGATDRLERRSTAGDLLAMVYEQPSPGELDTLEWLYGTDGTSVVVGHTGGLALVGNDGTLMRELAAPPGAHCIPVRWWEAGVALAACRSADPPYPHEFFHQLWLVPSDGSASSPLTTLPAGEVPVVDFGHHDAWPTPAGTRLQWFGDCGAAAVQGLAPDGTAVTLPGDLRDQERLEGFELLGGHGGNLFVQTWLDCDMSGARLLATDPELNLMATVVPLVGEARGVLAVAGLAQVYP